MFVIHDDITNFQFKLFSLNACHHIDVNHDGNFNSHVKALPQNASSHILVILDGSIKLKVHDNHLFLNAL